MWLLASWPEIENMDGAAIEVALMDDLRDLWPEATNEDIRHGLNLAMAGAETAARRAR